MNLPFPQNAGHGLSAEELFTTTALKTTNTELKMTPFHESPYSFQMEFQNVAHKISDSSFCTSTQLLWPVYSFIKWSTLQQRSISELFDIFKWNSPMYTYKTVQPTETTSTQGILFFLCKECLNIRPLRSTDSKAANVDSRQESSKHVKTIGRRAVNL